jgi:hypothetical protein
MIDLIDGYANICNKLKNYTSTIFTVNAVYITILQINQIRQARRRFELYYDFMLLKNAKNLLVFRFLVKCSFSN